jgi:steroid delta-isomerase-like uncharacterized protein
MRSPEEAKEIVRRFYDEVFNKRNLKHADEVIADDVVERNPLPPGTGEDKNAALSSLQTILDSTPDLQIEIHDMVATGERVATRATFRGTDGGNGWGAIIGAAATGKRFSVEGIDVLVLGADGRFTEHYGIYDAPGMMVQLGLMPASGGAPPA